MIRSIVLLALLLFVGCSNAQPKPKPSKQESQEKDLYLLMASDSKNRDDYNLTAHYYEKLYEITKDTDYKKEQLENLLNAREFSAVIDITSDELKNGENRDFRRYKTLAYVGKKELEKALENGKKLLIDSQITNDLILIGDLYYLTHNYHIAVKHYKKAYAQEASEQLVDKIASILYEKLNKNSEAIAYYETHIIQYGCSEFLCQRLANLYAKKNNIYGVISAYKRIYNLRQDEIVAQKIVELYLLLKDYKRLSNWLEDSRYNDLILLEIYRYEKELIKASVVALRLYEEKGDIDHLAMYAIFSYEANEGNRSVVLNTVKLLERVVAQSDNHIYLNYLGYLLIDHGVDVDRGVGLVERALKGDPSNPYYKDSLAWGYYMQGKSDEAFKLIKVAKDSIGDDKTLNEHYEAIYKAVKKDSSDNR